MEINDDLLAEVERAIKALGATRSEFICNALKLALRERSVSALEKQHREGYEKSPQSEYEIDEWETERV